MVILSLVVFSKISIGYLQFLRHFYLFFENFMQHILIIFFPLSLPGPPLIPYVSSFVSFLS